MRLVGRLKKLEAAAEEHPRVMAAGIVWTSDHEHYAGELQPGNANRLGCPHRRGLRRRSGVDASRSAGAR